MDRLKLLLICIIGSGGVAAATFAQGASPDAGVNPPAATQPGDFEAERIQEFLQFAERATAELEDSSTVKERVSEPRVLPQRPRPDTPMERAKRDVFTADDFRMLIAEWRVLDLYERARLQGMAGQAEKGQAAIREALATPWDVGENQYNDEKMLVEALAVLDEPLAVEAVIATVPKRFDRGCWGMLHEDSPLNPNPQNTLQDFSASPSRPWMIPELLYRWIIGTSSGTPCSTRSITLGNMKKRCGCSKSTRRRQGESFGSGLM